MQIRAFVATRISAMTMGTIEDEQFVALVRGCACGWNHQSSSCAGRGEWFGLEYFRCGECDANRHQPRNSPQDYSFGLKR